MLIDVTLKITPDMVRTAPGSENKALAGHWGTHFDGMNQDFPLEYTSRDGIVFDVSEVKGRDIEISDIDMNRVSQDMFVAFYTGFIEKIGYGGREYFGEHPQLSNELIDALIDKGISLIGLDFAGIRRGNEHIPKDQYCADRGVFIIENLCNLKAVADAGGSFIANTYPMNYVGMTGLPCRVVAEL